ncbi:hypothetical protein [Phenylobacterium immobile]|uniref:hypothetical protein n=1 Tax=Phenylobacterium immobile TaxID=21 RepID=UPI000B1393ED|nr:hypothetical protein [Phenylobacterium immobile]
MAQLNRRAMLQFSAGAGLTATTLNGAQAHERQISTTAEALDSLAPRMRLAGVPLTDIEAVRAKAPALNGWTQAWTEIAERHLGAAQELLTEGYVQPAGEHHQQAAMAYHFARLIPGDDKTTQQAAELAVTIGADALALLDPGHCQLTDSAVLRYPPFAEGAAPLAVLVADIGAAKEELAHRADALLKRGVACVTVDSDPSTSLAALLRDTVVGDQRVDLARVEIDRISVESPRAEIDLARI